MYLGTILIYSKGKCMWVTLPNNQSIMLMIPWHPLLPRLTFVSLSFFQDVISCRCI